MTNNGGRSNEPISHGLRSPDAARRPRISGPAEGWAARECGMLLDRVTGHPRIQGL
ncbi:hypothetical protein ACFWU3_00845 [Streptomyces sp. NPDC058685]|uniref:hypothetical protein n=1 Tax=Streptomyces sp. NPDC058685 TaxID=3346598 RepID=UPI003651759E